LDGTLADLPRLVPVAAELRRRGRMQLGLGISVAAYWLLGWALDQPVQLGRTLFALAVSGPISILFAALAARARLRAADRQPVPPPRMSVYETRADARERHARAMSLLLLGVVALLVFDRLTGGAGTMAGLIVGLTIAVGAVDLVEAGRWSRIERRERLRMHLLLPARALLGGFGQAEIYSLPGGDGTGPPQDGPPRLVGLPPPRKARE
jgi:hypothetical protein